MRAASKNLPQPARKLGKLFEAAGHETRVVGGWVRDTLTGIEPKDLDLATTATPDEIIQLCETHGLRYFESGVKHGTVAVLPTVKLPRDPDPKRTAEDYMKATSGTVPWYEITTLRIDRETDGRHAEVEFTTDWRADAARRDFTINAMSMDLQGKVYDYFDGIRHLNEKRIIFVGEPAARIQEDYLRILRFYRFRQRLQDRTRDRDTRDAIRANATGLQRISAERIWMEMKKILAGDPIMFCTILCDMLDAYVLQNIGMGEVKHCDIVRGTNTRDQTANPVTILASMTYQLLGDAWKMSHGEFELLGFLQDFRLAGRPSLAVLKDIAYEQSQRWAVELASLFGKSDDLNVIREWTPPTLPIRGQDLIDLGHVPGKQFRDILDRLTQAWKDSDYQMGKDALIDLI